MLAFATQLMSRRDAPMRALAANAGAHFPLIVRSRFCLCLSGSAFLPFAKEFFQIFNASTLARATASSMPCWRIACPAYPALELVPRRSPRLSMRESSLSAVYSVNFYEFANSCLICHWLAASGSHL